MLSPSNVSKSSVIGPIRFDANGDIAAKAVSVYRATRDGLTLRDVVRPSNRLTGCPPRRTAAADC